MSDFRPGDIIAIKANPTFGGGNRGWAHDAVTHPIITTVVKNDNHLYPECVKVKIPGNNDTIVDSEFVVLVEAAPESVNERVHRFTGSKSGASLEVQRNDNGGTLKTGIYIDLKSGSDWAFTTLDVETATALRDALTDLLNDD